MLFHTVVEVRTTLKVFRLLKVCYFVIDEIRTTLGESSVVQLLLRYSLAKQSLLATWCGHVV